MLGPNVQRAIRRVTASGDSVERVTALSGGSINHSMKVLLHSGEQLFVKVARDETACPGMFAAEAEVLNMIAASNTVSVPETRYADEHCLIQTLFVEGRKSPDWHASIGQGLAQMHQKIRAKRFGFQRDNYLGTSLQKNRQSESWLQFWRQQRVAPQISCLSAVLDKKDRLLTALEQLSARLDRYLEACAEPPVLIHGDLWSGNAVAVAHGAPIIFDPAGYFASREAEFGMMRLFGGFGPRTEAAYEEIWPFEPEFDQRVEIYRLYHIVNHLIIFGRLYYDEALAVAKSLL